MNQDFNVDLGTVLTAVEEAGLFVSLCTIQALSDPETSADDIGQPDEITYASVTGLVDIPCMKAPMSVGKPSERGEIDMFDRTLEASEFHLLLNGHYPQIVPKQRALVDGIAYDVKDVESDSQSIMTRLALKQVSV